MTCVRRSGPPPLVPAFALVLATAPPPSLAAQIGPVTGYALSVGSATDSSPLNDGEGALFQRLRLTVRPRAGPLDVEIAYEHGLRMHSGSGGLGSPLGAPTAAAWLDLQWTVVDDDHVTWTHRFDRLWASVSGAAWEITVGRQTVSWATTLILTPADPFAPFDPSDPFRAYRAGVDAARVQYFPGPLSEVDLVVRPADTREGTTVTALLRGRLALGATDLSGWAGAIHDAPGAALAASRSVGPFELRGEASVREDPDGSGAVLRLAVGADRRLTVAGRDLYVVGEYQHEGFGAADAGDLIEVVLSDPYSRGELQVLGQNELALSGSYQLHPLWSLELLGLLNLGDGSVLLAPAAGYSAASEVALRGGIFFSFGDSSVDVESGVGSEYGPVPASAYVSLTWFF